MPLQTHRLRISFTRTLAASALLCLFCTAGRASVINDPQMGMEDAGLSTAFTPSTIITPTNGGGTFEYYNPTGQTITKIDFFVQLTAGITPSSTVTSAFQCNNATTPVTAPNPYFEFCSVSYFPSNGLLVISFSGIGGVDQGIPPLLPGCDSTPDGPPPVCTTQGHFAITLNYNFDRNGGTIDVNGDQGGWYNIFGDASPTIGVLDFQTSDIPEPATVFSFAAALIGIAALRCKRRK